MDVREEFKRLPVLEHLVKNSFVGELFDCGIGNVLKELNVIVYFPDVVES